MNNSKEMTKYFRSAVAAQSNMGIDFKDDKFYILSRDELISGKINTEICKEIFSDIKKGNFEEGNDAKKRNSVNIIFCAKTVKTIFEDNEKVQDEIEELTGLYYIPAVLDSRGNLKFDDGDKKLPWFPREYLMPMIEPKLAVGTADEVDGFMSSHVDRVEKIKSWLDYAEFYTDFYEAVTASKFDENTVGNLDEQEAPFELEDNIYIFVDKTVYSTFHILKLYNHLQTDDQPKALYNNFVSTKAADTIPLRENNVFSMQEHCGQMGGEYPLSPSQREAVNHFNCMNDGEILAVNGPPGTGKTTLLQTIVADMFVKRAVAKEKAPLIVASSTNNQAVTNIISSFGSIKRMGTANLEERWIQGVDSFATYFPSTTKVKEAQAKGYQFTNQKGEFFVSEIEDTENIEKSKEKMIQSCKEYFGDHLKDITSCRDRLHEELLFIEKSKNNLLSLAQEVSEFDFAGETIDKYLINISEEVENKKTGIDNILKRVYEWEERYKKIPWIYRTFKFFKVFLRKIHIEFRLFMSEEEQEFLTEYMSLEEIKEKYSVMKFEYTRALTALKNKRDIIEKIKRRYDSELDLLLQRNIVLHAKQEEKYKLEIDFLNSLLDKKHRYMAFWLSVHYFECRWVSGEDQLTENQKGTNYTNVLDKFYNRLGMITPCMVMTFYMLPRQFLAYSENESRYMFNHIDLLIVDEAGQVSPEIAAGAFSLAKKSVVVGDVYQIEPVWSVIKALDKTLALTSGVISSLQEYDRLEQTGLNSSNSSVMKVAAKSCKYEKFGDKGLFLSEHRRCYNEIIDYCNELVYKGNLEPLRGRGADDIKLAIRTWPQMGYKQIDSNNSTKSGGSRMNNSEAAKIAEWLKYNYGKIESAYTEEQRQNLVGIITPFKAQVECIKKELKKQIPAYASQISVGTVHTFQGAERKIIILSTVYGSDDGCFFIDAKRSLMNVAVSRAKDHFLVFGDINCLKDIRNSASGLLKGFINGNMI